MASNEKVIEKVIEVPQWFKDFDNNADKTTELNLQQHYESKSNEMDSGIQLKVFQILLARLEKEDVVLSELNLAKCNIQGKGLELLGYVLRNNTTIHSIDVRNNNISSGAVRKFMKLIEPNYSLKTCLFAEDAKDLMGKSVARYESFDWYTIESMFVSEDESCTFQEAVDDLKKFLLTPNMHHNSPCMMGEGNTLYLSYRTSIEKERIESMLTVCSSNITILFMEFCKLTEVPFDMEQMPHLEELNVSNNLLTELPEDIGSLKNLRVLAFSNNQIKAFPASVALLKNLERISVEENQITELPIYIVQLEKLRHLSVWKNPIEKPNIPKNLLNSDEKFKDDKKKGSQVLSYLKEICSKGSRIVNRCKLMFVGDGGVGKHLW